MSRDTSRPLSHEKQASGIPQRHDGRFAPCLRPRVMFPAPPIIFVPEEAPDEVREAMQASFALFWSDLGASATRLRTSVERLLDHFGVAKTWLVKKPAKPGKRVPYDLSARINRFVSATTTAISGGTLHALRVVGNVGTHSNSLTRDALLDAYTLYEDALAELIGERSKKLAKLVKKIKSTKGRY